MLSRRLSAHAVSILLAAALLPSGALAQKAAPIRVSYQPATYWSLPFLVATEQGFWAQEGLNPELSPFPSGAPQVDAGGAGGVGRGRHGLGARGAGCLALRPAHHRHHQ